MGLRFDNLNDIEKARINKILKELKQRIEAHQVLEDFEEFEALSTEERRDLMDHVLTTMEREQTERHLREAVSLEERHSAWHKESILGIKKNMRVLMWGAAVGFFTIMCGAASLLWAIFHSTKPHAPLPGAMLIGAGLSSVTLNFHVRQKWKRLLVKSQGSLAASEKALKKLEGLRS